MWELQQNPAIQTVNEYECVETQWQELMSLDGQSALTKGWSFLQALRSWDSLLRAMPDIAAHQRPPVENNAQRT